MQEIFIKRLLELLESVNMTQTELAKRIGTTNVTISRYISGERKPRIEIVVEIAKAFGVSVDYLLGYSANIKGITTSQSQLATKLYSIVNNLGFLDNQYNLSEKQIDVISKLLEANKDFIIPLKNDKEYHSKLINE